MVIGGEKAPAFSATTLTLPPPQIDNSGRIIENTRRNYSRTRSAIEEEIASAIKPPEHLQKRPQSKAQAKQWPVGIQPVGDAAVQSAGQSSNLPTPVTTSVEGEDTPPKPRRKRTRTRKRKTATPDASSENKTTAVSKETDKEDSPSGTLTVKH